MKAIQRYEGVAYDYLEYNNLKENEKEYIDALAIIILDEKGAVYTREPKSELRCPLQQPVCDNNSNSK